MSDLWFGLCPCDSDLHTKHLALIGHYVRGVAQGLDAEIALGNLPAEFRKSAIDKALEAIRDRVDREFPGMIGRDGLN